MIIEKTKLGTNIEGDKYDLHEYNSAVLVIEAVFSKLMHKEMILEILTY